MSLENLSANPLPLDVFPKNLLRHVDPKAPPPLRDMGAKGLVPGIAPDQLALVLFQLHFDPEAGFRATAAQSFADLPVEMKQTIARAPLPAPVLDLCARRWHAQAELLQLLLANPSCADVSIATVANLGDAEINDIVADYQVRFLRAPLIIEQLYLNPSTRQSTLDRVLELAKREGVPLDDYPGLRGVSQAMSLSGPPDTQAGATDEVFAQVLLESVVAAYNEEASGRDSEAIEKDIEADTATIKNRQAAIARMNIAQRVRLATLGSKEDRAILIRDPNRLVHMAAVHSPKVTQKDIYDYADNKNLPEGIINFLSGRKEATRDYVLLCRLVRNPKLHLQTGLKFLNYLRPTELKNLSRDRNVSPQLQKMAKSLLDKRGAGRGG